MAGKTTIDGVQETSLDLMEFVLGGGSGKLAKVKTSALLVKQATDDSLLQFSKEDGTESIVIKGKEIKSSDSSVTVAVGSTSVDLSVPKVETPIKKVPDTVNFWQNDALHMEHTGTQVFDGDVEFKGSIKGLPESMQIIQCKELVDMIKLVPVSGNTAFVPSHSVCMMTLVQEMDGTPAVRYDVVSTGKVSFGTTTTDVKTLNVKVSGILSSSQYAFIDSTDIRGVSINPTEPKFYDYRADLTSRQTNNLKYYIRSEKTAITANVQLKISFVLPNEDYGMGVPFPYAPRKVSKTHKVFSE